MEHEKKEALNNSVLRACFIMDLFTPAQSEWTLKSIARECGISVTTALPFLRSLEKSGYLERDEKSKTYRLGMKFVEKSQIKLNSLNIIERSDAILRELSSRFGTNTHLAVLDRTEIVYLARHEAVIHSLTPSYVGKRLPAFCTALGKVMLAYMPTSDASAVLECTDMVKYTQRTKNDRAELLVDFENIRRQGYAVDDEEYQLGGFCVAAPVFNSSGDVCAAVSASITKTAENMEKTPLIISALMDAGSAISQKMGCRQNVR